MDTKSSTLRHHGTGVSVQTPLLIPSFSSKGFALTQTDNKSEISKILNTSGEFLTETFLISAYDIAYQHIPAPNDLPYKPELIFLDSGGYEISTDRDYSSVIDPLPAPHPWNEAMLKAVIDAWPDDIPLVIVSYDHHHDRKPVAKQVAAARKLFKKYPQHLNLLLLKPETVTQTLIVEAARSAIADAAQLSSFDIIGVTEKELGRSMLDRMVQIAKLRRAMDEARVTAPIHVFGALDPVSVCLYYVSGAEIFDGLTWIRYGFDGGRCVYTHNMGVLKYGIDIRDELVRARALADNYYYLQDLQRRLREFDATKKVDKLAPHAELIANAYDSLNTRLKRRS